MTKLIKANVYWELTILSTLAKCLKFVSCPSSLSPKSPHSPSHISMTRRRICTFQILKLSSIHSQLPKPFPCAFWNSQSINSKIPYIPNLISKYFLLLLILTQSDTSLKTLLCLPSHMMPVFHSKPSHARSGSERGALLRPLRHFPIRLPPFYFKSHVIACHRTCPSIVTHLFSTISAPGSLARSIFS